MPDNLIEKARSLCRAGERRLLGIVGAPGSGKSTFAAALADGLDGPAVVIPMDGFHLAQVQLDSLGRRDRKGAPDTFDVASFVVLLQRLRAVSVPEIVYAPTFRRDIEEPIAGAIAVAPKVELVIVEGNYLLLDGPWSEVAPLLDGVWYLDTPDDVRNGWLLDRHMRCGRDRAAALAWIARIDLPNALLILHSRDRATSRVTWPVA